MITNQCDVYVIDQGFVALEDLSPGMMVYTLDSLRVEPEPIKSVRSEFIQQKINVIDSGQHNVDSTNNTLHLYHSEINGSKYLTFNHIDSHVRSKSTDPKKYNPVLAWPYFQDKRNCSDLDLEYVARSIVSRHVDYKSIQTIMDRCTGDDALVLVDMLEFWCSDNPGRGSFGRVSVKSRLHTIESQWLLDELCKTAALAGFTSHTAKFNDREFAWRVYYEPMPVAGSRPKTEKFKQRYFVGNVYQVETLNNRPVLGRSKNRTIYLPTSQKV